MSSSSCANLHLLMVEDDSRVVDTMRDGFSKLGCTIQHAGTIAEARRFLVGGESFDAILLDLSLPDGHGATIADACRSAGRDIPILMVTGQSSVDERIDGLSRGADDYICKPFSVDEVIARLEAVLRRVSAKSGHIIKYCDLELDLVQRKLRRADLENALSAREVDLLAYLMSHPEQVLEKERILKDVWGDDASSDPNVLHVYANYLRNRTEGGRYPRLIHTVRGVGYVLSRCPPDELLGP